MKENNMHTCLIFLEICVFCVVILSRRCYGADYRYEACGPRNCSNGPNISFPFYIYGQDSYCGYRPALMLSCGPHGFPVISLSGTEYVVKDIFYETQTFRVHNSAIFSSNNNSCITRISNTTLPHWRFNFAENVTKLNLFSNCTDSLSRNFSGNMVFCDVNDGDNRVLALYGDDDDDDDENIGDAVENCKMNLVAPVEDDGNLGMENLTEVLRRGFVLNWIASDCSECRESGGYCGFNQTDRQFKCFCPDRPHASRCNPEKPRLKLILATAISVSGLVLCLLISLILWRCKRRLKTDLLSRNISSDPYSKSDIEQGSFHFNIPIFSYKELVEATNNFDSSKELGDGGFGTVYYGKLHDGREVAIKRLYERSCRRVEQFMNEIKILTNLRHKNLVSLYGCTSRRSKELLLVYEYVPNGTIADHLHGEKADEAPLTWPIRMKIAIETASALAYLHKSDIIHRDVKTNNILLDSNFCVKVADFGLSRLFPNDVTHVSTAPQGTPGYVDPNYHQCYQLTDKSDVYSFGVVLIELVSSMPAVDISRHTSEINLANLAVNRIQRRAFDELIDSSIGYESDVEVTRMTTSVAELAFQCLQLEKDMRPSMDEVLDSLMHIQGGDELDFETKNEANDSISVTGKITPSPETDDSVLSKKANDSISVTGKITPSPGTDDIVLLKKKRFQSSPNAVTDMLVSSSTTRSSYHKSLEI